MTTAEWSRSGWIGVEQALRQPRQGLVLIRRRPESEPPVLAGVVLSCSVSTGLWLFLGLGWMLLR